MDDTAALERRIEELSAEVQRLRLLKTPVSDQITERDHMNYLRDEIRDAQGYAQVYVQNEEWNVSLIRLFEHMQTDVEHLFAARRHGDLTEIELVDKGRRFIREEIMPTIQHLSISARTLKVFDYVRALVGEFLGDIDPEVSDSHRRYTLNEWLFLGDETYAAPRTFREVLVVYRMAIKAGVELHTKVRLARNTIYVS